MHTFHFHRKQMEIKLYTWSLTAIVVRFLKKLMASSFSDIVGNFISDDFIASSRSWHIVVGHSDSSRQQMTQARIWACF